MEVRLSYTVPVEVGTDYKDYLVSSIVPAGSALSYIRILSTGEAEVFVHCENSIRRLGYKYPPVVEYSEAMAGYSDMRVRYYNDDRDPVWIALYSDGTEQANLLSESK